MYCYPTKCKRSIEVLSKNLADRLPILESFAQKVGITSTDPAKAFKFRPVEVPIIRLCQLIDSLVAEAS